jgi:hypothetical protein
MVGALPPKNSVQPLPISVDCDRPSNRLPTSRNSASSASILLPADVASSISVFNNMDVAKSALHRKQYLSLRPGRSNSSSIRPQTLHCSSESTSLPLGPDNIMVFRLLATLLRLLLGAADVCSDRNRVGHGGAKITNRPQLSSAEIRCLRMIAPRHSRIS